MLTVTTFNCMALCMTSRSLHEQGSATVVVVVAALGALVVGGGVAGMIVYSEQQQQQEFEQRSAEVNARLEELRSLSVQERALADATLEGEVFITAKLEDGSVTSAKILDGTVEAGDLAEEAILEFQGGNLGRFVLTPNAVTEFHLADGSVREVEILEAAVTSVKLASGAVSEVKIADGTIENGKLADGAVETVDLATGTVSTIQLKNGSVTSAKLAAGSVDAVAIAEGAVGASELAVASVSTESFDALSVTAAKIANGTITDVQIASDGSVVKSVTASGFVDVTDNGDGTYSIALSDSCSDGQVFSWNASSSVWVCSDQSVSATLATGGGLEDVSGLRVDVSGSDLTLSEGGLSVADNFIRNDADDSTTGTITASGVLLNPTSSAPSTAEGTLYYDSDNDTVYVRTSSGLVELNTDAYTTTELDALMAAKAASSSVYTKSQTYTQAETDAAIALGGSSDALAYRVAHIQDLDMRKTSDGGDADDDNNYPIYTVPTGKKFVFHRMIIHRNSGDLSNISTLGTDATFYSNMLGTISEPSTVGEFQITGQPFSGDGLYTPTGGETIYVNSYGPSGASSIDIELFGYLYDE